jgi:hypothetical protein
MARGASAIDCGDESRSGGMAMAKEPESQVDQRMAALLPELLLVLRRRRLAVAALVAAAPACWLAWPFTVADDAVPATPVAAPAWTIVRDDELQGLLGEARRDRRDSCAPANAYSSRSPRSIRGPEIRRERRVPGRTGRVPVCGVTLAA